MKPTHILSDNASARAIRDVLISNGFPCSVGPTLPNGTKYEIIPDREDGRDQIEKLNPQDIIQAIRIGKDTHCESLKRDGYTLNIYWKPFYREIPKRRNNVAVGVVTHAAYMGNLNACLLAIDNQTVVPAQKFLALDNCELSRQQEYYALAHGWTIKRGNWKSPNPGRQWALDSTTCDWIWYVDGDDIPFKAYLEKGLEKTIDIHVGIIHANRRRTDGTVLITPDGHDYWRLRLDNYVDTSSIWRVYALRKAGGWKNTERFDDWDCALRVTALGWKTVRNPEDSSCTVHPDGSHRNSHGTDTPHVLNRTYAVVCLLAGRKVCWDEWSKAVVSQTYPEKTHFYLCDNSFSMEFRAKLEALSSTLLDKGVSVSILDLPIPFVNKDWLSRHEHVANLYNHVLPKVNEDLLLLWEDDVIPYSPTAVMELIAHFDPGITGGICGLYESRDSPGGACGAFSTEVWDNCPSMQHARGKVLRSMGFIPGGFALYNNALIKEAMPLFISFPDNKHLQGWDGLVGHTVRRFGKRLELDGTVECVHKWRET